MEDDEDEYQISNTQQQHEQIDHIIKAHSDSLRCTLAEARRVDYTALQRAAKGVREIDMERAQAARLNAESEQRAAHFKIQAEYWQGKWRALDQTRKKLREALEDAKMRVGCTGGSEEDAESSYVDPERGGEEGWSTWQACKACGKHVGMVMIWPCRHVSVCVRCEGNTKACPVCLSPKTASIEVRLP